MSDVDIGEKYMCVGCRPTGNDSVAWIDWTKENAGARNIQGCLPILALNRQLECLPTKFVNDFQLFILQLPLMSAQPFAANTGPIVSPDMVTSYCITFALS